MKWTVNNKPKNCTYICAAGDGVLRGRLGDRSDQKHQRELPEGGVDRLHLQRDPQGKNQNAVASVYMFSHKEETPSCFPEEHRQSLCKKEKVCHMCVDKTDKKGNL